MIVSEKKKWLRLCIITIVETCFLSLRKMNASKKSNTVIVDGMAGDEEISQLFSNKYEQLYNSVPFDFNVFEKIKRKINKRVLNERDAKYCVCVEDVVNAV